MTTVLKLKNKGVVFVATFDADGVLDTVERDGVSLTANNAAAKIIAKNASHIRAGIMPARMEATGWTWVPQ